MKVSTTLKPLVFAIAAAMALAVQANSQSNDDDDPLLDRRAGDSSASVSRDQYVGDDNAVSNEGTENTVELSDSLEGNDGNVGANFAAGSMNQQGNDVVIATADEDFVFGTATASITMNQDNEGSVAQVSNANSIDASGFGNDASGNVGLNMAAGDLNQQGNALAIATARGWEVNADGGGEQSMSGNTVDNRASSAEFTKSFEYTKDFSRDYTLDDSSDSTSSSSTAHEEASDSSKSASASASASYDSSKSSSRTYSASLDKSVTVDKSHSSSSESSASLDLDASASASIDTSTFSGVDRDDDSVERTSSSSVDADLEVGVTVDASRSSAHESSSSLDVTASVDKETSATSEKSREWSADFSYDAATSEEASSSSSDDSETSATSNRDIEEVETSSLATAVTFTEGYTFLTPVTNTVSLSDALNGASGNMGVNIAAGTSNQQMNTMSIAVGCDACSE
jgi:hypothetical protein